MDSAPRPFLVVVAGGVGGGFSLGKLTPPEASVDEILALGEASGPILRYRRSLYFLKGFHKKFQENHEQQ